MLAPMILELLLGLSLQWLAVVELVEAVWEVVTGVGSTRLLSVLSGNDGLGGVDEKILELESLNEVRVPDESLVGYLEVGLILVELGQDLDSFLEDVSATEDGGVLLHGFLHGETKLGGGDVSLVVTEMVEVGDRGFSSVLWKFWDSDSGGGVLENVNSTGSSEDDQVKKRVGSKSVGSVHGVSSALSGGVESWHNLVSLLGRIVENLSLIVGWNSSHVVVDSWDDWNWLLRHIDSGEDHGGLGDSWESLLKLLGWQMVKLKVDVILVWSDSTSLHDLDGHRARNDVTGGEILGDWGVTLHETFSGRVDEVSSFSTGSFGDKASSSIDSSWVELNELHIGVVDSGSGGESGSVSSAGVSRGAREEGSSVSSGGQHGVLGAETMDGSVFEVHGNDSNAGSVLHDEVEGEVLNEVVAVVLEGGSVESVEKGVSSSVSDTASSVSLSSTSEIVGLSSESSLVDLSVSRAGEWHSVVLKLNNGSLGLSGHVVDGILVSEPIGSLDGVVEMPPPVIGVHVSERSVDTSLCGDGVRAGWEEFGDDGGLQSSLGKSHSGTKSSSAGSDDDGIVGVVDDLVLCDVGAFLAVISSGNGHGADGDRVAEAIAGGS